MKQLPLFIASTFRDMDDERDELVHVVLPQVNQRLRAAGHDVAVYPVDLRWGITSRHHEDPAMRERFILDTCVTEVRRCQPLFLGLLGDKYGYVADWEVRGPVVAEAGLTEDPTLPLSVSAIELLTAVGSAADHGVPPVFLRRRLGAEDAAAASTTRGVKYVDRPDLVDALCQRLVDEDQPVVEYRSIWQADSEALVSADFVRLAVEAILTQVMRVIPATGEIDWLERELAAQREHSRALSEVIVGRDHVLHEINEFLTGPVPTLESMDRELRSIDLSELTPAEQDRISGTSESLTLIGAPGAGLSTILARATEAPERWAFDPEIAMAKIQGAGDPGPRLCAVVHIGATRHSADPAVALLLLLAQIDWPTANRLAAEGPERVSLDVVLEHWLAAVRRLPLMGKAVIALDGLDLLRAQDGIPKVWAWMPLGVGRSAVFLVSTRADSVYAALMNARPGNTVVEVTDLTESESAQVVLDLAERRHRLMPASVRHSLIDRSRNPRWLTLATDLLLTLTGKEYRLLRHPKLQDYDDEVAIEMLLTFEAERLPLEPASLQLMVVSRLRRLIGDMAPTMVSVIAECGMLRETDLMAIFRKVALEADPGKIATVRALLRQSIGSEGPYLWVNDRDFAEKVIVEGSGNGLPPYERVLVQHLLDLPHDDEIRVNSLSLVLLGNGLFDHFAVALADPTSSDEHVAGSAGPVLRELLTEEPQLSDELLAACASDAQRLAVAELLLGVSGQLSPEHESAIHLDIRRHLRTVSPTARTRSGSTAATLEDATRESVASHTAELRTWASSAVQRPEDLLHDLPVSLGSTENPRSSGRPLAQDTDQLIEALDAVTGLLSNMAFHGTVHLNKRDTIMLERMLARVHEVRQGAPERLKTALDGYSLALAELVACLQGHRRDSADSMIEQARDLAKRDDIIALICAMRMFEVAAFLMYCRVPEPPRTAVDLLTLCKVREVLWESYWLVYATSTIVPSLRILGTIAVGSALKVMTVSDDVWPGDVARAGVTGLGTETAVTEFGAGWCSLAMLALAANEVAFTCVDPGPLAALVPRAVERYPGALGADYDPYDDPEFLALVLCLSAFRRGRLSDSALVVTLLQRLTDPARSSRVPLREVYEAVNEQFREFENDLLLWDPDEGFVTEPGGTAIEWGQTLANTLADLETEDVGEAESTRQTAEVAARARYHLFLRGVVSSENILGVGLMEVVSALIAGEPLFVDDPGIDLLRSAVEAMMRDPDLSPRERHGLQVLAGIMAAVASWG